MDVSADFAVFDNVETVTYQQINPAPKAVQVTYTVLALKRATVGTQLNFGQGVQAMPNRARWHLRASDVPSPRRGDLIISTTSGTWVVLSDDAATFGSRHVVETQQKT